MELMRGLGIIAAIGIAILILANLGTILAGIFAILGICFVPILIAAVVIVVAVNLGKK